jgi:hypothetical protein
MSGSEVGQDAPASCCLYPFFARHDQRAQEARPRTDYTHRDALATPWKPFAQSSFLLQ